MRIATLGLLLVACTNGGTDPDTDPIEVVPGSELIGSAQRIDSTLEPLCTEHNLPALGGAAIDSAGIFAVGVCGTRHRDTTEPVTISDRWHLGSDTKAMTGTLAGILVHDGVITYETTVDDVWPNVHESWKGATLEQLVTHRSGATGSLGGDHSDIWSAMFAERDSQAGRTAMVAALTARPQDATRGEYTYSNAGFIIAGAMFEVKTGKSWESLMQERLFAPYGMDECGFGPPQGANPWGHSSNNDTPVDPTTVGADNPPALGPAGTVHCSLASWGQFVALHLRGAQGNEPTLPDSVFERLHTPVGDNYAHGWIVANRPWADGSTLSHRGSNTMWLADMWVAPEIDRAFLAVTNTAVGEASDGVDGAVVALILADLER